VDIVAISLKLENEIDEIRRNEEMGHLKYFGRRTRREDVTRSNKSMVFKWSLKK
jgi:hypothetical protein